MTLDVQYTLVHFEIDTGSDVTVLEMSIFLKLSNVTLTPPDRRLEGADESALNVAGKANSLL